MFQSSPSPWFAKVDDDAFARVKSLETWLVNSKYNSSQFVVLGHFRGGRPSKNPRHRNYESKLSGPGENTGSQLALMSI